MLISSSQMARAPFVLLPLLVALCACQAQAANFNLTADSTSAQTLGSGSGQAGSVKAGVKLTVGGSAVAVTVSGANATLDNQGTIAQTGSGRAIRDNTGVANLVVTNGSASNHAATVSAADADVIQMAKSPASVTLNNYGSMISPTASAGGAQAVDLDAIASGSNVVNNYAGALLKAFEADAVRPGVNGVVNNAGKIWSVTAAGSSSDGVDAQNNSGIAVNNAGTGVIEGGRHGITGGAADAASVFTLAISNLAGGVIQGDNGSGVNIDGFNAKETITVTNGGTIVGRGVTGDGDGVDVDGLVNLINTGTIRSLDAVSASERAFSEGMSVGGGTIVNSGLIEGLVAAGNTNASGIGITLTGNDITSGANAGNRDGLYGNTVVTNQAGGTIRGQTSSGILAKGLASGFTLTINNDAGATVSTGGSADAAIQTGADNDTINNRGRIDGGSSGRAVDMGAGNNTLNILGGSAVIVGNISGGVGGTNTLTISPGAGNSFAYAAGISNFNKVEITSGTVTLSGTSTYTGTTVLSGGTLVLDGAHRLAAASALDLEGGTLKLVDVNGANGQAFAVLSLGKDSAIDLGDSSLTFDALGQVVAGKTLSVTDYLATASPGYALRFLGDLTHDVAFLALMAGTTIDSLAATYRFDGTWTDVTAVPEPANLALFLAGLGLTGVVARRRKR
ncbi:MAG: PEP-CTERM sorting domain-containing protein [Betaproteobacteria bacterium]